jgi:hypothetical protein
VCNAVKEVHSLNGLKEVQCVFNAVKEVQCVFNAVKEVQCVMQ